MICNAKGCAESGKRRLSSNPEPRHLQCPILVVFVEDAKRLLEDTLKALASSTVVGPGTFIPAPNSSTANTGCDQCSCVFSRGDGKDPFDFGRRIGSCLLPLAVLAAFSD